MFISNCDMFNIRRLLINSSCAFDKSNLNFMSKIANVRSLQSMMKSSEDNVVFFANSTDLTERFKSENCCNISKGAAIKSFIKKYPDAVYTTARISGENHMVRDSNYSYKDSYKFSGLYQFLLLHYYDTLC